MAQKTTSNGFDHSPLHLMRRAVQRAEEQFQLATGKSGLTPSQYFILLTIKNDEGLSQKQIVGMTGVDRSTMTASIRRLQKKGFIKRRKKPDDHRAYEVRLTDEGREILALNSPLARQFDQRLLAMLSAPKRELFLQILREIIDVLSR